MRVFRSRLTVLAGLTLVLSAGQRNGSASDLPTIISFSPEGTVKEVRQVRASFSVPMTNFGDPRGNGDPFEIHCPAPGHGRWADPKNWIYDFDKDLEAGIQCEFKVRADLKSVDGKALSGKLDFTFDTGGPAIKRTQPWEGSTSIDENQAFVLSLDAAADSESVLQHAHFEVEGIPGTVPVTILDHDPRTVDGSPVESIKSKVKRWARKFARPSRVDTRRTGRVELFIQAKQAFPTGAKVTLVWGAGIKTVSGIETKTDQVLNFQARPQFTAEFHCERENAQAACIPIESFSLRFSANALWRDAKLIRLKADSGAEWKPEIAREEKHTDEDPVSWISFKGPFPAENHFKILVPSNFKDESGRPLSNLSRFPLEVSTSSYPPLIKFPSVFGIIELKGDGALPVTVRNIEPSISGKLGQISASHDSIGGKTARLESSSFSQVLRILGKVESKEHDYQSREFPALDDELLAGAKTESISLPKPNGEKAFEVMGIPLKKPGFYVVELESARLGDALLNKKGPMYVRATALVTNLSVHLKYGRESSLVWVTALDTGKPVSDAQVSLRSCSGDTVLNGVTDSHGIWKINQTLPDELRKSCSIKDSDYSKYRTGFFALAEKDGDFSFVNTHWDKGIESWRFNFPRADEADDSVIATTVFDRTLFRAGETVHMKHFFRRHSIAGIQFAPREELPKAVRIEHQEGHQSYDLSLKWNGADSAESTWTIPKGSKLGHYSVTLTQSEPKVQNSSGEENHVGQESQGFHYARDRKPHGVGMSWYSGSFQVEEYRVPLMKAKIKAPSQDLIDPKDVPMDLAVEYFSGGAAAKLPVQVRYQSSQGHGLTFSEFDGFEFANGKTKKGDEDSEALVEDEAELDLDSATPTSTSGPVGANRANKQSVVLDGSGTTHVIVPVSAKAQDRIRNLKVEFEFRDPNGETQTASQSVQIYPSSRVVGLRTDSWLSTKKEMKFQVAVADLHGKAIANTPVSVDFFERSTLSHRKRLVGGFYAYENKAELKRLGEACSGKTDEKGLLYCDTKSPISGNIVLEAKSVDESGRVAYTNLSTWIAEDEELWFGQEDSDRIDVLPERKQYEPGEKAVFQVRMPFREATALVTVEREGVMESFTVPLSGKKPLIEVPILPNYAPNVYVSALVVRGRVGDVQPTALVDLGRPAYKLGMAQIRVGWKSHELKVKVTTSKNVYQVREKGRFKIHVEAANGSRLPENSEVALAAVDEGLLALKDNISWKLLDAMMRPRQYEVETATAQGEVVGKRHFGMKALAPGGDGGKAPTREIFDSLIFWRGNVVLDQNGDAEVEFPMNDSLTNIRLAAVAHAGSSLFGTGVATIRTTQDLMILSGIPPLAREGDKMNLEFTLRNTTVNPMRIRFSGKAEGITALPARDIMLEAGKSEVVRWPVEIPFGVHAVKYELEATSIDGRASDRIKFSQKVMASVPTRIFQATLAQLDKKYDLPVERPKDALMGKGGVRLIVDPTILTGLDGVRSYMSSYPYSCMEQRVSVAIALQDKKLWDNAMADLPSYLDGDGLVRYFPVSWILGSDVLSAYLISISHEAGWEIPEATRGRILSGLTGFVEGRVVRGSSLVTSDLTVRKLAALEALSRYGKANWQMIGSLQVQPNLWPTSAVLDWFQFLKRQPQTLEVSAKRKEADQILRSRLNFQGTVMGFSTENIDQLWWMMVSTSVNSNRLILSLLDEASWKEDMGRIARGSMLREHHGHWDTTTANAWGVLAMQKFASVFEKRPVAGTTQAYIPPQQAQRIDWSAKPKGGILDFDWPASGASKLDVSHSGTGSPWITVQSLAAIPLKNPLFTGYRIQKSFIPVEQKNKEHWSRGDIVRVHLDLESQADMTWVVVNDPIPAGATILGSGLGNDSSIASGGEKESGWTRPAFQERAFDGYRAYYEFVPKGKWSIEYTIRLNQTGTMSLPSTRVEAMYAPESFGELPNANVSITE